MHNQENLEEGYFGDVAKNILGRPVFNTISKIPQKASDYVKAAADKLTGMSDKLGNISQSLRAEPTVVRAQKSWRVPVDAEEGRQRVAEHHAHTAYTLVPEIQKHAKRANWEMAYVNNLRNPNPRQAEEIRDDLTKQRAETSGKKKPKAVTDKDIQKAYEEKFKPQEQKQAVISKLLRSAHNLLAGSVSNSINSVYEGKKPHSGVHLNTGFGGYFPDEEHIGVRYAKAWESAGEAQASMPRPEDLFGEHTHHVGEGHEWIIHKDNIGESLAKDAAKANKQARAAYADAVKIATGHVEKLNTKRAQQRATNAAGTQLKLVEAYNNHHIKLNHGMMYGGFPSNKSKFLTEMTVDGGGLQPGNPNQPIISEPPASPYPPPQPGNPGYWYRPPSGPFTGDGETPGTPPGPKDPRWKEWERQWRQNNPPPTRQPGESDKDYQKRRDEYQRLLDQYGRWRESYYRWWLQHYGRQARPMG